MKLGSNMFDDRCSVFMTPLLEFDDLIESKKERVHTISAWAMMGLEGIMANRFHGKAANRSIMCLSGISSSDSISRKKRVS